MTSSSLFVWDSTDPEVALACSSLIALILVCLYAWFRLRPIVASQRQRAHNDGENASGDLDPCTACPRVDLGDSTRSLPRSSRGLSGSARPNSSFRGSIQITNDTFASIPAGSSGGKRGTADPEKAFTAWPKPLEFSGVDLGGWHIKMHRVVKTVAKAPGVRTFATVTLDGSVVVGNLEDAMENPERTMYDLTSTLAENAEAAFTASPQHVGERAEHHHAAHLLACILRKSLGHRDQVVGISIPPQLADGLGMKLYGVAMTAGLSRVFAFNQTAALCRSYLHRGCGVGMSPDSALTKPSSLSLSAPTPHSQSRRSRGAGAKPSVLLIVDCGASGASVAVCVPRSGDSIDCVREFFTHVGGSNVIRRASEHLKRLHPEASAVELHEGVCAVLREYCDMEEYQLQNGQAAEAMMRCYQSRSGTQSAGRVSVRMGRDEFTSWFLELQTELAKVLESAVSFLADPMSFSAPNLGEGDRLTADVLFNGKPFSVPELRAACLEQLGTLNVAQVYPPEQFSVSEGTALLASAIRPATGAVRSEITPLFLNPTVTTESFNAMRPGQPFRRRASEALGNVLRGAGSASRLLSPTNASNSAGGTQTNFRRHSSLVP